MSVNLGYKKKSGVKIVSMALCLLYFVAHYASAKLFTNTRLKKRHNTHIHYIILVDLLVKVNPTLLWVLMVFQGSGWLNPEHAETLFQVCCVLVAWLAAIFHFPQTSTQSLLSPDWSLADSLVHRAADLHCLTCCPGKDFSTCLDIVFSLESWFIKTVRVSFVEILRVMFRVLYQQESQYWRDFFFFLQKDESVGARGLKNPLSRMLC